MKTLFLTPDPLTRSDEHCHGCGGFTPHNTVAVHYEENTEGYRMMFTLVCTICNRLRSFGDVRTFHYWNKEKSRS